ncbi:MAG TPA: serine protease [Planctomycetaceae bacterium]|nr:serine protease [Planctomycetaceae bacterium]
MRRKYICQLSERTGRNTVIYYSAWLQKSGDFPLGIDDTDMNGFMSVFKGLDRSKGLDLVLHTPGGVLSATEAIIDYFRDLFGSDIRVIVPQLAMSAGTLIALSAREIVMGCHSSLGPIDPQFGGVSAHGVIEEFNTAKKEINENPGCAELWKTIISKYRPTFIGDCQKAIKWGDELARKLLSTGMFAEVEEQKGREIIRKIIDGLADHDASKAHDRHFSAKKCAKFGLNVTYLEDDKELQDAVLSVHHAAICLVGKPDIIKLIENQNGKNHIVRLQYDSRTKP